MNFWKKIKSDCAALSLNCREASHAQAESLAHPIPRPTRVGVWIHLLICKWCRCYGKQLRFLHDAAHRHDNALSQPPPSPLSPEARDRMKRRIKEKM